MSKNVKVENQVEYKTAEGIYQFMVNGNWYKLDKVYERTFKKADKAGIFKREITSSFPNFDKADTVKKVDIEIDGIKYQLMEEKYGLKSVCHLEKAGKPYYKYVSKKVIISVIADETSKSWNWVDQHLKAKLGLKVNAGSKKDKEVVEI